MPGKFIFYTIFLTAVISVFLGCRKEINSIPVVLITPVTNVSASDLIIQADIADDGGVPVTYRGVCWSTSQYPTVNDHKTLAGSGTGSFMSSVTGLTPGVKYYLRAYAINEFGTGYSTQINIAPSAKIPVLTTSVVSSVSVSSAQGGGDILSDGGADISSRGVCWSTRPDPTIADSKTTDGAGAGTFVSSVTGLNPGTVYYVRAYATSSAGTGYGEQVSFTTSDLPLVSDGAVLTLQSATIGNGIDLVFMGDGYTAQDITSKKYENNIKQAVTNFFNIEPYKSYSAYFNVYMVYAFSEESGISDLTTTIKTRFETKFTGASTSTSMSTNASTCLNYVRKAPIRDIRNTVAVVIANSTRYGGTTYMNSGGLNIAICPMPQYYFSYILQHEAGGHAFGTLADEYVSKTGAIPQDQIDVLLRQQSYGIFKNVDITGKADQTIWKHFTGVPKYGYVSTYEGGYLYPQGVWRPEVNSIMLNNVRYFNAPAREIIVKRIMKIAGMTYSFEEFQAKDVMELTTKSAGILDKSMQLPPPVIVN